MNEGLLLKLGLIQSIGFILFVLFLFSPAHMIVYFLIGITLFALIVINAVYIGGYLGEWLKEKKNG